jgi:methanogenic corrinoid protein MtbC1
MSDHLEGLSKAEFARATASENSLSPGTLDPPLPNDMAAFFGLSRQAQEAVASEIIARLLLLHRVPESGEGGLFSFPLRLRDRDRFLTGILQADLLSAGALLDDLIDRGVSPRQLLLELLPDTAQRLGTMWEREEASFSDVTLALCSLHQLLRERSWKFDSDEDTPPCGSSILLTTLKGEQHIFGVMIAAEVFRDAGWQVTAMGGATHQRIIESLEADYFDILGLSAATITDPAAAARELRAFRAASTNRDLKIIVGGRAFTEEEDLFSRIGADAWARDASTAPVLASGLHASPETRM